MDLDLDRNLIPFTNIGAMWIGRYSRFGVFWPFREVGSLQALGCIIGTKNHILTAGLLRWRVFAGNEEQPPAFPKRTYYPWAVIEECDYGPIHVTVTTAFAAPDALLCRFELKGEGPVRFEFDSPWEAPRPIPPLPRHPWRTEVYNPDTEPVGTLDVREEADVRIGERDFEVQFFYGAPDLPNFQGMEKGTHAKGSWAVRSEGWSRTLEAGQPLVFNRCVGFGFDSRTARQKLYAAEEIADDWSLKKEKERFLLMYGSAPPLHSDDPDRQRLYHHAIAGLSLTVTRGHGGFWGTRRITLVDRYQIVGQWYWDTAFTILGLREFAPDIAHESAMALLSNLAENGAAPLTLTDDTRHGEGQGPLMAWAIWMLHKARPDRQFLFEAYPLLVQNDAYWFTERRAKSGLCKWANAAQSGCDNDARFEPCGTTDLTGCVDLSGVESADLNAFLVAHLRSLSAIAHELGKEAEAKDWHHKAEEHANLIAERMYFADDAFFYDTHEETGEPFTRHKTPAGFLPIWAGVPIPDAEKTRVIEGHMLNPEEFFGSYPFPSLSYDDPLYNPHSYWRGRIWPHYVYWMIELLWKHGYHREATHSAHRLLEIFRTTPYIHECYPSDGYDPHMGLPEYNWGLAACLEVLLERYKERRW